MSAKHGSLSEQARRRLAGGDLIQRGFADDEIAEITQSSISSVRRWRKKVDENGLQSLARQSQSGRPRELGEAERLELKALSIEQSIRQKPTDHGYPTDQWTSRVVVDLALKKWGVQYTRFHIRYIIRSLRLSFQKPNVKSAKHSPAEVEHWRRYVWPRIKKKRTKTV